MTPSLTELPAATGSSGVLTYLLPKRSRGVYSMQATFVPAGDTVAQSTGQVKRFVVVL